MKDRLQNAIEAGTLLVMESNIVIDELISKVATMDVVGNAVGFQNSVDLIADIAPLPRIIELVVKLMQSEDELDSAAALMYAGEYYQISRILIRTVRDHMETI